MVVLLQVTDYRDACLPGVSEYGMEGAVIDSTADSQHRVGHLIRHTRLFSAMDPGMADAFVG